MTTVKSPLTPYVCEGPGRFRSLRDGSYYTTVTPPQSSTLWGASVESLDSSNPRRGFSGSETKAQAISRFEANVGQSVQAVRLYDNGGNGAGSTGLTQQINASGKLGVCTIVGSFSYNSNLTGVVNGTYDGEIRTMLGLLPTNIPSYITAFHEFDSKIAKGTYTFAQVYPAINHVLDLIAAYGNPSIIPWICYTGSSFTGTSGRFATYQPSITSNCKAVGVDPYENNTSETADSKILPLYDTVTAAGLDFMVTETASRLRAYTLTVGSTVTAFTLGDAVGNTTSSLSHSSTATQIQNALNNLGGSTGNGASYTVTGSGPFTIKYLNKAQAPWVVSSTGGTTTCSVTADMKNYVTSLGVLQGKAKVVLYFNNGPDTTSTNTDNQIDDLPGAASAYGSLMAAAV